MSVHAVSMSMVIAATVLSFRGVAVGEALYETTLRQVVEYSISYRTRGLDEVYAVASVRGGASMEAIAPGAMDIDPVWYAPRGVHYSVDINPCFISVTADLSERALKRQWDGTIPAGSTTRRRSSYELSSVAASENRRSSSEPSAIKITELRRSFPPGKADKVFLVELPVPGRFWDFKDDVWVESTFGKPNLALIFDSKEFSREKVVDQVRSIIATCPAEDAPSVAEITTPSPLELPQKSELPKEIAKPVLPKPSERTFDQSKIAAMLDKRVDPEKARQRPAERLAVDIAIRQQILPCWHPPFGAGRADELRVTARFKLNPDGSISDGPSVVGWDSAAGFRALADSALRAIRRCAPLKLSLETYELWKDVQVTLDPKDLLGAQ